MDIIRSSSSWTEFEQALGAFGSDRNHEKGRAFEELTRLYLLTEPIFATKLEKVWHHSNVPQKIVDELGLQRPEIGVDLIAQAKDGTYWAIQCKFHQNRSKNVTYKELQSFFGITERQQTYERLSHRLVCTSAYGISEKVTQAHPRKLGFLTSADFSKLGGEEFAAFHDLLLGKETKPEPYEPMDHQRRAIEKALQHFKDAGNTLG